MGIRYSEVKGKHAREMILLKSFPCCYGKCSFCNYIEDNSEDEEEINAVNEEILQKITGRYKVLEIVNSGSVFEIPKKSLEKIREIIYEKEIEIVYFEIFYSYLPQLESLRAFFNEKKAVEVRYRMGLETFDNDFRQKVYNKNIFMDERIAKDLSDKIYSVCLLIATQGQSREMIKKDIALALKYFQGVTINVFVDNGTKVKRDENLVRWFVQEVKDLLDESRVEVLIDNKDLGVYEQ